MSTNPNIVTVDVRGEICPAPLIKATEAIRAAGDGQEIEVLIDFQPAVLAVTVPMGIRFTKAGVTAGIVAGLIISLTALLGGRIFDFGILQITVPNLLPDSWTRFDASFLGLAFNVPITLAVSRFTDGPNPENVARIRAALNDEFRPNLNRDS